MTLEKEVQDQLAAIVADEGLELVATEVVGSGSKTILRLIVDSPDGVNLDQCASVSRQASATLDVEDPIHHHYTLEVSSPYIGQRVRIRMAPSFREHRTVAGELLGKRNDLIRIFDDSGQEIELPIAEIFEARLEVDWTSILKEGKARS
jgi:ribosome maturation factor RimP